MELLRGILERIAHITLVSSMMFGVILLLRMFLLKRIRAKYIYLLWVVLMIRLIFPFELPFHTSIENYIPRPFEVFSQNDEIIETHNSSQELITYGSIAKDIYEYPTLGNRLMYGLIYLWLFGIAAILFFPIISYNTLMKAIRDDDDEPDARIESIAHKAAKEARVVKPQIRYSYYLDTPALLGVFSPTIILPRELKNEKEDVIYYIMLHELVHYGDQHLLFRWAFWFVKAVYWFNPMIWVAHEWMKLDAELACDDEVVAIIGDDRIADYGQCLINLSRKKGKKDYAIQASGLVNSRRELKKRIERIGGRMRRFKTLEILSVLVLVIMIPLFFTVQTKAIDMRSWYVESTMTGESLMGDGFRLTPLTYAYDSDEGIFHIKIDVEMDDELLDENSSNEYMLSFGLSFPESFSEDIRRNSARDLVGLSQSTLSGQPLELTFQSPDYQMESYGNPVLVFLGYEVTHDLGVTPMIMEIDPEALPLRAQVDNRLTIEVDQAYPENGNRYFIGYTYKMEEPLGLSHEEFSCVSLWDEYRFLDQDGAVIPQSGSRSGGMSEDYVTMTIQIDDANRVARLEMSIQGYTLSMDSVYLASGGAMSLSEVSYSWQLDMDKAIVIEK